jgi:hypothetical protein
LNSKLKNETCCHYRVDLKHFNYLIHNFVDAMERILYVQHCQYNITHRIMYGMYNWK